MSNTSEQTNGQPSVENAEVYIPEKVIYTGLFIDETAKASLLEQVPPHFEKTFAHHLTLKFRPDDGIKGIELGSTRTLKLVGQVVDEEIGIQACLVEPSTEVATSNKNPHITISSREGVSPVKSNEAIDKALASGGIQLFESPIEIEVTEGFFDGTQVITSIPKII